MNGADLGPTAVQLALFITIPLFNWLVSALLALAWWRVRARRLPGERVLRDRFYAAAFMSILLTVVACFAGNHAAGGLFDVDGRTRDFLIVISMGLASLAPLNWLLSIYLR